MWKTCVKFSSEFARGNRRCCSGETDLVLCLVVCCVGFGAELGELCP